MKGRPPMSIPRAATSVQIRNRACANRESDQSESVPAQRETERPIRNRAGEKATNQKACLVKTAFCCCKCVRPMRKRASTPNNHKGIYKGIQSKSVPVQTGSITVAPIKLSCNHNVCLLKKRPIKKSVPAITGTNQNTSISWKQEFNQTVVWLPKKSTN